MDGRERERRLDALEDNNKIRKDTERVWVILMVLVFLTLAVDTSMDRSLSMVYIALGVGGVVLLYAIYSYDCTQVEERLGGIAERAEPVSCTVEDSHICEIAYGYYGGQRSYYPAVEFCYERDGDTHWSVYPYPDGISERHSLRDAQSLADEIASAADGAAYYDPQTDQAFLINEPQMAAVRQWTDRIVIFVLFYIICTFGFMLLPA